MNIRLGMLLMLIAVLCLLLSGVPWTVIFLAWCGAAIIGILWPSKDKE